MEALNSLAGFFYNFVPGVLFIFFLDYLSIYKIGSLTPEVISTVLIFGLFLGFVFQGVTKMLRMLYFDQNVFERVSSEQKTAFDTAIKILKSKKLITDDEPKDLKKVFYLMDNYLRGEGKALMLVNFTARLAFWSNIFVGMTILGLILILDHKDINGSVFIFYIFAGWLSLEHLNILYDSVLQTFVVSLKLRK